MSSDEKSSLLTNEKKIRFRQPSVSKVLSNNDRVEDLYKNDKCGDTQVDASNSKSGYIYTVYIYLSTEFI